jgi:hypothetical protein
MKKIIQILFCSFFCCYSLFTHAQLLSTQNEYHIKFGNGKALSYQSFPVDKTTLQKTENAGLPTDPKKANIAVIKTSSLFNSDSLVFENFNSNDNKQIWVLEFSTPTNRIVGSKTGFDFKGEVNESDTYFTIKNKVSGKYLTRTSKSHKQFSNQVLLSPLSKNGQDENQHWIIRTVDESLRGKAFIFLGRASLFGISPRNGRTDLLRPLIEYNEQNTTVPGVFLTSQVNLQNYHYSLLIEPATKAEKIILNEITTVCPKTLLKGDRDFATGTRRDFLNRVIEENHKMGMRISVVLTKSIDNTQIWAKVTFVAEELGGDGTKTEGTWDYKVYEAIRGRTIKEFVSAPFAYNYFEFNMNENVFKIKPEYSSDIINYYTIIGDTLGDDVSTDDDCGDDTRIERIKFNPVYVFFNN